MIPLADYLIVSVVLLGLGFVGIIINRRNLIILMMCIELMLLAVNTNFIAFAQYLHQPDGEVFVFFILTVAAVEAAVGLAILVLLYRRRGSINVQDMNLLKG
ncbi:MAG: NADH dehydrogenase (ubiquinone), K subunit [uncultured bacterium]|nr:MAG: NADH dehydrogenase (ubiquinone), K subunit [uncultured bacterium]OGT26722.1 MAG: NADH-quinone oxidoreductase subunit K [Gammaproteobacteria bacterium RIFCSPHIGHO2_02_FULL_42_43]OGT27296.1 MAG: NADH-quinone oxidoreductase subunit K [Gammaproteobacteria bacterium RIFCSPHIGHO2_01_FULL_42_8]OGT52970.1 MAG: NADH-quinone oxidoreductase subunit K [Gammaproteobacteria bacterium RIFCSPHIGHO2_12_FULL_41_25]OGT61256.1 MAG: NADH-quinone oxidoreductase subunit K [Gammaproteobacteria bacterium RIFCSP